MDVISGTFFVMASIAAVCWALSRLMEGEPIFPKPHIIEDLEGVIKLGVGFTSVMLLIAATGIFGYDFAVVYIRVALTIVMLVLIYSLLRYRPTLSLLLIGCLITLVIFNPIEPITMDRSEWIPVDILVAIILPILAYRFLNYHTKREAKIADARGRAHRESQHDKK